MHSAVRAPAYFIATVAVLLQCASPVAGTPDIGLIQRRILLGSGDEGLYSLLIERTNPGSYYRDEDSLFVCRHDPVSGRELERTFLRATTVADTSANLDGQRMTSLERERSDVDLVGYLAEHRIRYAFPSEFSSDGIHLEADSSDIYIVREGQRAIVLDGADVRKMLKICQAALRPMESYRIDFQYYLVVECRWDRYDAFQAILVLPVEKFTAAREMLRDLIQKERSSDGDGQ